ncbi:hypothetical protein, partial [Pseudomonas fluorescens]|uniref:hypothetical protein n=1 Tax=Pseudomonas fluorescens TaxID=294 RepID=UPI001F37DEE8
LAPAGLRSSPKQANVLFLIDRGVQFQGRFAPQREQAPSPQQHALTKLLLLLMQTLRPYTAHGFFTYLPRSG